MFGRAVRRAFQRFEDDDGKPRPLGRQTMVLEVAFEFRGRPLLLGTCPLGITASGCNEEIRRMHCQRWPPLLKSTTP